MDEIKVTKKVKLKSPCLIAAWPGMGEVAFKAAKYLVENLKAEEFARIMPQDFFYFTGGVVHEGVLSLPELPLGIFYYYKNKAKNSDLVIFISNAQPDLTKAERYCEIILNFAKSLKIKTVINFAAMPLPIDHTQPANAWLAATSKQLVDSFKKNGVNILPEGQISGMNGLFLGLAKKNNLSGFCILGEIPLYTIQIENPKAAYVILEVLIKMLNLELNISSLLSQAGVIEEEINKLIDFLKLGSPAGPIGEEEIEKIKKTLSQLTKLPVSVKEKIEGLFKKSKTDISKANELKVELDKWNVYKEYEDRFLDLFKKSKNKDN
ncbi:MAG: PAC2 family protein [Candidatus Omnitrophota bacterium]